MGPKTGLEHGMTDYTPDTPPGVRIMCDGGTEPTTVTKTAVADSVVTREVDGDEQEMLRVPISSTRSDRENDEFDKGALEEMADQIRVENPMVFDNHGLAGSWMEAIPYDSRETIGAQMDAELESAEDGEWDLYSLVNPDGTHPEGERLLSQVRDEGQPIKFSVGFRVINTDEKTDDAGNEIGRIFTSADLMETSRVGIPANPDASVTQSVGVAAKDGAGELPGYANHPMMQMFAAMNGGQRAMVGDGHHVQDMEEEGAFAAKDGVNSETVQDGTPVEVDGQPETTERSESEELESLRAEVAELREAVKDGDCGCSSKGEGDPCDDNGDCGDGMVCVDGECVPEEDVDGDDDEEESSDTPEAVKELREENKALRDEVADIRSELSEGRGDAKTGDTGMQDEPPVTPDETDDDTAEEQDTEHKTAMDYARGSE
jgi:hypothetical protein